MSPPEITGSPQPSIPPNLAAARRRPGFLSVLLFSLAVVGLLFSSLAWVVPHALVHRLPQWLKERTGREIKLAEASFNPFTLRLNAKNIALRDAARPLASLAAVEVKGSWATLSNFAWTVENFTLTQPEINARIASDGSLDWVRFLEAFPKSTERPGDKMPRILLHNLSITNAAIRLTDERAGAAEKRLELTPLTFKLDKLSTLPQDRGDYALQATLNDQTRVQWTGRVGLNPIESSGELAITQLPLSRALSIANVKLPVAIAGTATLRAKYSAAIGTDFAAAGIGDGVLEITELRATQNKDEAAIKSIKVSPLAASWAKTKANGVDQHLFALLPLSAALSGVTIKVGEQKDALLSVAQIATTQPVNVDLSTRRVDVPQINIAGLQMAVERARNGAVVMPFAAPDEAVATTQPAGVTGAASSSAWQINVAEIATDKATFALRDQSFSAPQVASAKLDLTLGATIGIGDKLNVRVLAKRGLLSEIALRDDGAKEAWLSVKEVRTAPFDVDVTSAKIELPKIDIVSPLITMALGKDGFDVTRKLAPASTVPTSATGAIPIAKSSTNNAPTRFSIAGASINGGRINFTDGTLPAALTHVVDAIKVNVDRIELDGSRPLTATTNATLASGGVLQAKLKFDSQSFAGEADIALERVTLAALSPYLNRNTRLKLGKGEAAIAGRMKFSGAANAAESLRFEGNAAVRDLALMDETTLAPFAEWAELSSTDITVVVRPLGTEVLLADLLLDQPRGKLIIAQDGTVNLTQIGKVDASAPQSALTVPPAPSAPLPVDTEKKVRVKVDRLQVTGGNIEFADLSLRPQFGVRVSDLAGVIVGLSTEPSSRAEVSMEGKVDEFGLARLSGNLSPLGAAEYTDLKATFRNLEMKNLTPYSGKFAGRTIESGKLSLDLEYKINQRKLRGENQIIIDNLTLGERVDSKDATSLPLDLALALLRDSKGVIDLGLPVQGSLDDPQFNYGSLIWKAIVNVLTKIVTAPFRALGALLGGSGEEFEAVIFEPGEARLLPPEREKLGKLAKALEQRPQLKLAVEGRFDRALDREALADNIVKLEISKRAGMRAPAANEPLIISLTDAKVQTALDELATAAGDDATKLRAQYLPPAGNAVTGLLQNARERLTEKGRNEANEARNKYYPELFKLLKAKQAVPDIAYATLAGFRAEAVKNTLTAVNKFDAARVSVAAPQTVTSSTPAQVATTLALSVK